MRWTQPIANGVSYAQGMERHQLEHRAHVVDMVAQAMSEDDILAAYPDLERDAIREALRYAAEAVRERELPLEAP